MATKTKKKTTAKASKNGEGNSSHPIMKGRDIIVKALENEGVEVIFGYPGGTSMEIFH